jgi:hypothetical protein
MSSVKWNPHRQLINIYSNESDNKNGFTTMLSQFAKCHSAKWLRSSNKKNCKLASPADDYLFK